MRRSLIYILGIILFTACGNSRKSMNNEIPSFNNVEGFDLQGHRGARGWMPENTIPAFIKGLEMGSTTLELDVVISKDEQVVVSHDTYFHHDISTQPNGEPISSDNQRNFNIYNMTYNELKRFDVGMKPHPGFAKQQKIPAYKPLLTDVFDAVKKWCVENNKPVPFYNIEIKCNSTTDNINHPEPAKFVDLVIAQIDKADLKSRFNIQSFDFRPLQYLHQKYPHVKIAALVDQKLGFKPSTYSPHYKLVTPELVKKCHDAGVKIIPWTINNLEDFKRIKALGVDGIITDYPNLANE
jgi:glycerophosphoryl diester phosphodiesterase